MLFTSGLKLVFIYNKFNIFNRFFSIIRLKSQWINLYSLLLQIMITIANTFIFTVLTCLTLYRYVVQQNQAYQEVSQIHFQWQTVYLSSMLVVLRTSHSVTSKVNNRTLKIVTNIRPKHTEKNPENSNRFSGLWNLQLSIA